MVYICVYVYTSINGFQRKDILLIPNRERKKDRDREIWNTIIGGGDAEWF
jgi:hypothetical protein